VSSTANLSRQLEALGGDIHVSLQEVSVPMYMLDRHGKIIWLNDAGEVLIPGGTGRKFTAVLAPDQVHRARRHFALRMLGQEPFVDHETVLESPRGRHEIEISSVALRRGHQIVGVFGVIRPERTVPVRTTTEVAPRLTPRQHEVLRLLGAGMTTKQMAEETGLAIETVRNHVRALLAELDAQSRLEAVLVAHRMGLLEGPAGPLRD
jgi:DNA-binding CsgD family transcriptional regulator